MSESAHRDLPRTKSIHVDEPIPTSPSDTWRAFHETFKALADEELKFEPENRYDRWLRAHVSYEDQSLEYGYWLLGNGLNEGFKERFEVAATRAGITLRPSGMGPRLEIWLHDVFVDLLEHRSKLLFAATRDGGGIITRICEASAIHCARLEKKALVDQQEVSTAVAWRSGSAVALAADGPARPEKPAVVDNDAKIKREAVIKKVQNPQTYTVLSTEESALYFAVKVRTIYRWIEMGSLEYGARRGSITIKSVLKWEKRRHRKRPRE